MNWVKSVRFSPDVRLIVSGSEDNTVKIWDVNKYCVVTTYIDHLQPVNAVRWSPDGTCVASCSNDKKIKIFDIRSGRIIQHYDAHTAPITSLSYHPSGKYLVSSSLDSDIKIWDTFNSKILYTVHGHQGPVNSVAFSRDGDYICSGGADATLMVWKNNLSGAGYPAKSKYPEDEGLSRPVTYMKKSNKIKNGKSTANSKNSSVNVNKSVPIKNNEIGLNTNNSNNFVQLPPEMKVTFEKMVSQLELISNTIKIFDQRIQNLEGHITTLSNRHKKGFVQKQPPQMGDYRYLMENSGNIIPNRTIRNNNEEYQGYSNMNNLDYYTAEIYNTGSTFKDVMNINEDNKKNMFKTDIEINKISNDTQNQKNEIQNGDNNQYMGQIHEEYGYNINENQQGQEEGNNEQYENEYNNEEQRNENEQYEEEQGEEYIEQQGEEYEEMQGEEEQYNYEEQNEEGNYGEEEQMEEYDEEQDNGEEQVEFENNTEQINEENNNNNEQETPK